VTHDYFIEHHLLKQGGRNQHYKHIALILKYLHFVVYV